MKKNNKGFTITTTLFGTFILFLLLLASVLSILSLRMNNMRLLMGEDSDSTTGRKVATMTAVWYQNYETLKADAVSLGDGATGGLFCFREHAESEKECRYISRASLVGVSKDIYVKDDFNLDDGVVGHTFEANYSGYYEVYACGAQGGDAWNEDKTVKIKGGKGACITSYIKLSAGDTLFVNIGGRGNTVSANTTEKTTALGGFNGGGAGLALKRSASQVSYSQASGGGATDIRLGGEYYDTGTNPIPSEIKKGTITYSGPNYKAVSGSYQIDIYGNNLTECDYSIYNNGDIYNSIVSMYANGNNHYVLNIHVKEDSLDGGIEVRASQDGYESSTKQCIIKREVFSKIENRILVAAGGGGSSYYNENKYTVGGGGGFITGLNGIVVLGNDSSMQKNSRGTQVTGGGVDPNSGTKKLFVNGGSTGDKNGSGGGGGYYGGAGSNDFHIATGGGSSFVSGVAGMDALKKINDSTSSYFSKQVDSNQPLHYNSKYFFGTTYETAINDGDGKASIKYLGTQEPKRNGLLNNVRYVRDCINEYTYEDGTINGRLKRWQEIQIIKNGKNLVQGIEPYATIKQNDDKKYKNVTDGKIQVEGEISTVNNYSGATYNLLEAGMVQCLSFDLGSAMNIDEVAAWHTGADSNGYYKYNTIEVSADGTNWTIFDFSNTKLNKEDTNGKRITAWEDFNPEKVTKKNYVWMTYDYDTNKTFNLKEYVDTGYKVDFSRSFKIQTKVKISKLGKNYLIVSNLNDKDITPTLLIKITKDNNIAVEINGTEVASSDKNSVFANEYIDITFSWDALTNSLWLTANGEKTHFTIRNDKKLHPYHLVDWSKDFEINTTINVSSADKSLIAGTSDDVSLSDKVTINTIKGKFSITLRKNSTNKSYDVSGLNYNEDVDVKFKWYAERQEFEFTAIGEKTNINVVNKFEVADGLTYYLRYGMADNRKEPEAKFTTPITIQYFRIMTQYLPNIPYYDTPKANSGREVSDGFKNANGVLLQNGMNTPSNDERYVVNWKTNYTNVVYDYNMDREYGNGEQFNTGYVINWDRDFIIDMDFIISNPAKLIYLVDDGAFKILTESSNKLLYVKTGDGYSHVNLPQGELVHMKFAWSSFYKKYMVTLTGNSINDYFEVVKNLTGKGNGVIKIPGSIPKGESVSIKSFKITDMYLKGEEFSKFPIAKNDDNVLGWRDANDNIFVNGITTRADNTTYNLTLIENKFTYHLDANGGSLPQNSSSSVEYAYGSTYGKLPSPTLAGKTFAGWYLDDDTTKIAADTKIPYAFDHTIYAKWK